MTDSATGNSEEGPAAAATAGEPETESSPHQEAEPIMPILSDTPTPAWADFIEQPDELDDRPIAKSRDIQWRTAHGYISQYLGGDTDAEPYIIAHTEHDGDIGGPVSVVKDLICALTAMVMAAEERSAGDFAMVVHLVSKGASE